MTPGRCSSRAAGVVLALLALAAGCTYYPTAPDVGGVRLQPEKGRAVRSPSANEAVVYFDLNSTGKYGDVLVGAEAPVARRAELRSPSGRQVSEIDIPGQSVLKFDKDGPRIVLSDLTRTLTPGEVIIVTVYFQKSGAIGIITVVE